MASLRERALSLYALPLNDLLFEAHTVHREYFDPNRVQRSTLLSIKTGGCPEDCGYCPQAARYHTGVENEKVDGLKVTAISSRLQTGFREFRGDPLNGRVVARLQRHSALQGIRGKKREIGTERGFANRSETCGQALRGAVGTCASCGTASIEAIRNAKRVRDMAENIRDVRGIGNNRGYSPSGSGSRSDCAKPFHGELLSQRVD